VFLNRIQSVCLLLVVICGSTFASEPIPRHPTSLVSAEVFVKRTSMSMRVTCFAEDLEMLQGVEALETGFYDSDEIKDATQDHAEYLAERLTYKYDKAPEFITIQQNMVAEGALLPSEFRVLLKQSGSDKPYAKMLKPLEAETFRFDWDNPALNEDDSQEEWEAWFAVQREKTLGISSYGSVGSVDRY